MDYEDLAEKIRKASNLYELAEIKKELGPSKAQVQEHAERRDQIEQFIQKNAAAGDDFQSWPIFDRIEFEFLLCEQEKLENQFPDYFKEIKDDARRGREKEKGSAD